MVTSLSLIKLTQSIVINIQGYRPIILDEADDYD